MNPFRLLPSEHIFKCAAGQVWKIGVTLTAGTGATDNFKIYLRNRFDPFLESVSTVNLLLAEVNAKNWSAYPGAPTGAPTLRPTSVAFVSKPDGSEAYLIAYWEDLFLFPTGERRRTIISALKVVFTESGSSNPSTGVGISASVTEHDVFANYVSTVSGTYDTTFAVGTWTTESVEIGDCGPSKLHIVTQTLTTVPGVASESTNSLMTYDRLIWIFAGSDGVFDLVTATYRLEHHASTSGTIDVGTIVHVKTEYCALGDTVKWSGVSTGGLAEDITINSTYDYWIQVDSSVRGVLLPKIGTVLTLAEVRDFYQDHAQTWNFPDGPNAGSPTGTQTITYTNTFYGGISAPTSSVYTHDHGNIVPDSETGTRYMPLTETSDDYMTLWVASGAAYHSTEVRLFEYIDGAIQDYTPGVSGIGPKKFYSADKIYHGHVVPLATSLPRVSIDPRAGVAHIAATDADAGHFY